MPVLSPEPHTHIPRGDPMQEYAVTKKIGNSTCHIVAPPPLTEEELRQRLADVHDAVWQIIREMQEKDEYE